LIIQAKRPYEYDLNLKPTTDLHPDSYAYALFALFEFILSFFFFFRFPSLESYMAVVIMGHLFFHLNNIYFLPIALSVVALVGLSRIYSRSRFPHQIIGSYIFGFGGLIVGMECCDRMSFHK
jgi:membrane-associated phospholipid phosphatase